MALHFTLNTAKPSPAWPDSPPCPPRAPFLSMPVCVPHTPYDISHRLGISCRSGIQETWPDSSALRPGCGMVPYGKWDFRTDPEKSPLSRRHPGLLSITEGKFAAVVVQGSTSPCWCQAKLALRSWYLDSHLLIRQLQHLGEVTPCLHDLGGRENDEASHVESFHHQERKQ